MVVGEVLQGDCRITVFCEKRRQMIGEEFTVEVLKQLYVVRRFQLGMSEILRIYVRRRGCPHPPYLPDVYNCDI